MTNPRVLGISGWSGAGKTTLLTKLIPELARRGLSVATLKHAHHAFDVDQPGKDSYEHRKAGARQVLISSERRWVLMHENAGAPEPRLAELLRRLSPCDLVLIEGFKKERHPKLEIYRASVGKPPLHPDDPRVIAVASDGSVEGPLPRLDLDDVQGIADFVVAHARPLTDVLRDLEG